MKYRIKLKNSRVVGPFSKEEILKLKKSNKVNLNSTVQEFPEGDWVKLAEIAELADSFESSDDVKEETFLFKLKDLNLQKTEEPDETVIEKVKPDSSKEDNAPALSVETFVDDEPEEALTETKDEGEEPESHREFEVDLDDVPNEAPKEAEEIKDNAPKDDKTKINPDYQKYLKELKEAQEKQQLEEERQKQKELELEAAKPDYENDSTQMISLGDIQKDLSNALQADIEFEADLEDTIKEREKIREENRLKRLKKQKEEAAEEAEEEADEEADAKRKKLIVMGVAFILAVMFLFDDEEPSTNKKAAKLIPPTISFPSKFDTSDKDLAKKYYNEALQVLRANGGTYPAKLKAIKLFMESAKNQFNGNLAMSRLIFYYSDLLDNSKKFERDANTIFKLVQIFNNRIYIEPEFASAISYFYYKIGKSSAAIRIFDKYMTVSKAKAKNEGKKVKVTTELFSVRLLALINEGKLNLAKNMAKQLTPAPNKPIFTYKALIEYYKAEEQLEVYSKLIFEGKKLYPDSTYFDIEEGYLLIEQGEFPSLKEVIKTINKKKSEFSSVVYSQFLTLRGFYFASLGKVDRATADFNKALTIYESDSLIQKLSLLEESEDDGVNKLVINSKAKKYLIQSKNFEKQNDLTSALKYAIKASDQSPDLIEPRLYLAKLQIKRGYIQDAIDILEKLYSDNSLSSMSREKVLFELIDAYTSAYKFKKVTSLLNTARNTVSTKSFRYAKAQAKYYINKGELDLAVIKTIEAQNLNPLDDENVYALAKLYIKFYRYKQAKNILSRAMDLDPSNVDYRILYAKILYEIENSESAIGYLFNVLEDFPDNPKILSAIGIYYYRSGQLKRYETTKKQLLELPKKDKSLYAFLIESARLDDDQADVEKYSEELVSIDPGDLATRMSLATMYIDNQKYKKAFVHLKKVEERLPSYPKLNFLYAKLNFLIGKADEAKEKVLEEIKDNPTVIDGYILLGKIYLGQGDTSKAREQYIKAIQINRKSVDAILGMAAIALRNNQFDMAIDQYSKAKEIDPNDGEIYRLLGDAYRRLGQSQLAISNYKQFLELSPNSKYKNKIQTYIKTMQ